MYKKSILLFLFLILLIAGCSKLTIKNLEFASMENNTLVSHSNNYSVGDTVYLVLEDIGSFEKDNKSMIKVDIDMSVVDFNSTVLLNKSNMLGDSGYLNVTGNKLEFPYVNVNTETLVKGKYTIFVKVKDLIGNKSAARSATFSLQ